MLGVRGVKLAHHALVGQAPVERGIATQALFLRGCARSHPATGRSRGCEVEDAHGPATVSTGSIERTLLRNNHLRRFVESRRMRNLAVGFQDDMLGTDRQVPVLAKILILLDRGMGLVEEEDVVLLCFCQLFLHDQNIAIICLKLVKFFPGGGVPVHRIIKMQHFR